MNELDLTMFDFSRPGYREMVAEGNLVFGSQEMRDDPNLQLLGLEAVLLAGYQATGKTFTIYDLIAALDEFLDAFDKSYGWSVEMNEFEAYKEELR